MDITVERERGVVIVIPNDSIDSGNAASFHADMEGSYEEGDTGMILDLSKVKLITSAGLRAILLTAQRLRRDKVKFAICSLTDNVRGVFQISGFNQIITVTDTREDAHEAVSG